MDRVEVAMTECFERLVQLQLGTMSAPADEAAAERMERRLQEATARRRAGTLDSPAFVRWAVAEVPWLARQLGDVPPPPRRTWSPPPAAPAPSPEAAALAARIMRHS